ncbi:uncharacterized protein [Bemisia tabaci]|uniref:uncharacterized protein n=1 Tax=Bemisia tabaci TaxID=7038 RepID=UPI0008F9C6A2|nr:PREDICTED: zinc finger protein 782-like [Bemisia tabaci]
METEVRVKEEIGGPGEGSTSLIKNEILYDDDIYMFEDCPPGPENGTEAVWIKEEAENSGSDSDIAIVEESWPQVSAEPVEAPKKRIEKDQKAPKGKKSRKAKEPGISCPRCGLIFKSEASLEAHFFIHTGEKPLGCPFCPKNFKFREMLNDHIETLHAKESFCERCMTQIRDAKDVKVHMVRAEVGCSECPAKFAAQCELNKHVREEHEVKRYVCNMCPAAFGRPNHLALHKRSHIVERPSQCPLCSEKFRQRRHLKTHMHAHFRPANRPWNCTACPAKFKRKRDLKEHLKLHE